MTWGGVTYRGFATGIEDFLWDSSPHKTHKRSVELLKSWLSPAQLEQYERDGAFEVVGSATGRRYRVTSASIFNVTDLGTGLEYCFEPVGAPSQGDKMLAQKVALETDELAALAVANDRCATGGAIAAGLSFVVNADFFVENNGA
jgi:hypothetical protein